MKKISIILVCALVSLWTVAQSPTNRSVQTIVADALAQMPTDKSANYNKQIGDLVATGDEGILLLVRQINAPGKGSNVAVDYALSGIAHYAAGKDEAVRAKVSSSFVKALAAVDDTEAKRFIIKQLQVVGKDEAVDVLAPLLGNEELSDNAARAIASIGTEKAGQVLKNALLRKIGTAKTQANVAIAIGEAGIEGAEELLTALLAGADEVLQKDVYYALSRTGGINTAKTLYTAAEKVSFGYDKTNATEAYIAFLKRQPTEDAANALLAKASKAGQNHTRIAALQILLNLQKEKGIKLVQKALKDPSIDYRNAALDYFSPFATDKAYVELLKTATKSKTPEVKVDVINWLGREAQFNGKRDLLGKLETGVETTAVGDLVKQLSSADFSVKEAAAKALVRFGNADALPAIAQLLTSDDDAVVALGKQSLMTFKGEVSPTIAKTLSAASNKGKVAGLEALALRKATGNLNNVLELTKSETPEVKVAAYNALKDVVGEKDQINLFGLLESSDKSFVEPLQQAVISALSSLPVAAQIETVNRRMLQAGESKQHLYYVPLAATGEPKALATILDGFKKGNAEAKDAAFKALLNCDGLDAASALYDIAKTPSASAYFDRALDAYIKLVSKPSYTGDNRFLSLRKAMEVAKTDAQKNEILKQIARTGTYPALLFAGEYLDVPALKENAAQAVMNIALNNKLYTGDNVVALLEKSGKALSNPDADYQRQSIKKHLGELPKENSFVSLFNGKDLSGWKGLLAGPNDNPLKRAKLKPAELKKLQVQADEQMHKDWIVENGLLAFVGHGFNNLCTDKQYGDFEMYVDWMLDPAGPEADAGIYLRGTPQVQIWDTARRNAGAQVGSGGLYNNQNNPSKPLKVADNKLGEWNTMYIKMIGDHVTVILNGELVTDNVILENYWDHSLPILATEQIELQAHGSKVYYRDIYVRELERPEPFQLSAEEKKEGFKILFDGTNMYEWTGNLVDYKLEDGNIAVDPTSSFGGNLYTKGEYANFAFRFEFQLTPSANNGVGIRAPMEGDNAYNAMEIQILDCEHPVYKDIQPYQHHGSIYGVVAAEHGAMKPVGEWNTEEIFADGNHIKITLNGKVILDADIKEATKNGAVDHNNHPGLFNPKGHIGFLGHGSQLKLRNIRIKELK